MAESSKSSTHIASLYSIQSWRSAGGPEIKSKPIVGVRDWKLAERVGGYFGHKVGVDVRQGRNVRGEKMEKRITRKPYTHLPPVPLSHVRAAT
jgi:hypothetical protein